MHQDESRRLAPDVAPLRGSSSLRATRPSGVSCKSCPDGRGSRAEDLAGVSPVERCRGLVAGLDVGEHLLGEVLGGVEVAVLEQLAAENPEEALDLVEPAGV